MRRAPPELGPLTRSGLGLLLLLLGARPADAQISRDAAPAAERARLAAELVATRLAGVWVPQAGASLSLALSGRLQVGGTARVALSSPTITREGSPLRLHFGYAGVAVSALPAPERWPEVRLGLLVGAGNANVTEGAGGTLVDSDNGPVIEPSVSYGRTLGAKLTASALVSWRFTSRFALVSGVRSRDLQGPSAGIGLSIGPF